MQINPTESNQESMPSTGFKSPAFDESAYTPLITTSFNHWWFPTPSSSVSPLLHAHPSGSRSQNFQAGASNRRSDPRDQSANLGPCSLAVESALQIQSTIPDGIWSISEGSSEETSDSLDISLPCHILEPTPIGPSVTPSSSPVRSISMDSILASNILIMDTTLRQSESHKEIRAPSPMTSSDASRYEGTVTPTNENYKRDLNLSDSAGSAESPKKRFKPNPETEKPPTYRPYQAQQWTIQFQELLKFKARQGHCLIPHTVQNRSSLSRWVKRQRYQYKLKQENKPSALSDDRIKLLEDIGFIWDSHAVVWEERLAELKEYKKEYGDCNVPSHFDKNPILATWIKCQRRQYRKFCDGESSSMTAERFGKLDNMGFSWKLRGLKNKKATSELDFV